MAFKRVDKETLPPRRWALKGRYGDGKSTFILALRQPASSSMPTGAATNSRAASCMS